MQYKAAWWKITKPTHIWSASGGVGYDHGKASQTKIGVIDIDADTLRNAKSTATRSMNKDEAYMEFLAKLKEESRWGSITRWGKWSEPIDSEYHPGYTFVFRESEWTADPDPEGGDLRVRIVLAWKKAAEGTERNA